MNAFAEQLATTLPAGKGALLWFDSGQILFRIGNPALRKAFARNWHTLAERFGAVIRRSAYGTPTQWRPFAVSPADLSDGTMRQTLTRILNLGLSGCIYPFMTFTDSNGGIRDEGALLRATQLAAYYIIVWEVPKGAGKIGIINQSTQIGWLPQISNQYLLTIIVVAVLTVAMYIYLSKSKHGYEIAVVGESQRTASYAGIKVERVIIRTMVLSGAICGIMGLLLVGGVNHTLTTTVVDGRGFTAVMVSWMAKFNPIVMVFTSLLLVFLSRGASEISSTFGLNHSFADILTGIILFFIIGSEFFIAYKINLRKSAEKEA